MVTKLIHADNSTENALFEKIHSRRGLLSLNEEASKIVRAVRENGLAALNDDSQELEHSEPRELEAQELEDAVDRLDAGVLRALEHTAKNLQEYHSKLLNETHIWDSPVTGGSVGELVRGLHRVAIYVPKADNAGVTTVLKNAIPARVAGVEEIILVTPPAEPLSDALLAAAWVSDVDRVITIGGAQAVAALAFGVDFIPKVDKLVGRADDMARSAGTLVSELVDVCFEDSAKELCIVADEAANPVWIAADLLGQAERGETAAAVLMTPSESLANQVMEELERQSGALRRKNVMLESLEAFGGIVVCEDIFACIRLANQLAPACLELMTAAPLALLDDIQNAGCICLGSQAPEALAEYAVGIGSGIPGSGAAAYASGLSVTDFQKKTAYVKFNEDALKALSQDIITLSRAEALTANANAVKLRFAK